MKQRASGHIHKGRKNYRQTNERKKYRSKETHQNINTQIHEAITKQTHKGRTIGITNEQTKERET